MAKEKTETELVSLQIDGQSVQVKKGTTILEAAKQAGIHIPHLCYHPAFPPEGSCRMCLIEIEGRPKLELACSTPVKEGAKIYTHSENVREARKGVLEFLLAEHPLDCPICDKAGECKLQDYYEQYGFFESQFEEKKEKKEKKVEIGKNLILDQERCILCTRCLRFLREVTGTYELGMFERGIHSIINIYENVPVNNNYSGNLAELCPVGAITDKDFRFRTRNWFLESKESICPLCSRGCNIYIEYHPGFPHFLLPQRVYRVKSRENHQINGCWICDYGRYGYSYIDKGRQNNIINNHKEKNLDNWEKALSFIKDKIKKLYLMNKTSRITLIASTWLSNEELFLIKKIFKDDLGVEKIFFADPPSEEGDNMLLTSERSPNRRGAQEIGLDYNKVDFNSLIQNTDLIFMMGPYLTEHLDNTQINETLKKVETKILLTPHHSPLNDGVDIVLPTCVIPEKEGSLTNHEGVVQEFLPVLSPLGNSKPEWEILVDLAKKLAINFRYYFSFLSSTSIREKMKKEISFFRKKSD